MCRRTSFLLVSLAILLLSCAGNANPVPSTDGNTVNFVNIVHIINKDGSSGLSGYGMVPADVLSSEIDFLSSNNLKATLFLQYDVLADKGYTTPVANIVSKGSEAGGFWHPTHELTKKAGVTWRGEALGDMLDGQGSHSQYTAQEKEKMASAYMEGFKNALGYYPKSIGSHYTDEYTINFMRDKYSIEAWFICETDNGSNFILNDGFEGIYYPNKNNASIPAQSGSSQINVPVIRVAQDDMSYLRKASTGYSPEDEIEGALQRHNNLVSGYTVTYFGGYALSKSAGSSSEKEKHSEIFKGLASKHDIRIETVSETAKWFKDNFNTTPPYAYGTYMTIGNIDRPVVRYNSRYYSINLVWDDGTARLRDIYKFDEKQTKAQESKKNGETRSCYGLPLADGADWSTDAQKSGIFLMEQLPGIGLEPIGCRDPREIHHNADSLSIIWKDRYDERTFTLRFNEKTARISATDNKTGKNSLDWMMALLTAKEKGKLLPFTIIVPKKISANICNHVYHIDISEGKVALNSDDTPVSLKLFPDNGIFEIDLSTPDIQ